MKAHYPAMFNFMKAEFEHRETLRLREAFLTTPSFMEHLLQEIYGDQHDELLPTYVRNNIPYPGHQNTPATVFRSDMKTWNS